MRLAFQPIKRGNNSLRWKPLYFGLIPWLSVYPTKATAVTDSGSIIIFGGSDKASILLSITLTKYTFWTLDFGMFLYTRKHTHSIAESKWEYAVKAQNKPPRRPFELITANEGDIRSKALIT